MIPRSVKKYLKDHKVDYELIAHTPAYTASETAQAAHVPGRRLAKVVMVKLDNRLAMALLPAHLRLDMDLMKESARAKTADLAHEYEFNNTFKDCEVGAMPPFAELYDDSMEVFIADSLAHEKWIAFNCGTHSELIKMRVKDLLKLIHPTMLPET